MAKILLGGNSQFVDLNLLTEGLEKAQWLDKVSEIIVCNSNKPLVDAAYELAKTVGMQVTIVKLEWQRTNEDGSVTDNRGALFQAYDKYVTKVNAIMCFSTGEDKATVQLGKNASKNGVPFICHEVKPIVQVDIMKTPALNADQRNALKAKFTQTSEANEPSFDAFDGYDA